MPEEELCKHCGMKPLSGCSHSHILLDDSNCKECPNMKLLRKIEVIRKRMNPEMLKLQHVTESPLYVPRRQNESAPSVNRVNDNLLIKGITRRGLLSHLKLIVMCQPLKFQLIDDALLLDVYFGRQDYSRRPKEVRESVESYNSINDLIGSAYDLVIITVGIQSYKNIASPSQMLEALKKRKDIYDKPTWILEPPGANWHLSRDEDVDQFLAKYFEEVELTSDVVEPEEEELLSTEETEDVSIDDYEEPSNPPPKRERKIQIRETANLGSDFDGLTDGLESKTKKWKGRY